MTDFEDKIGVLVAELAEGGPERIQSLLGHAADGDVAGFGVQAKATNPRVGIVLENRPAIGRDAQVDRGSKYPVGVTGVVSHDRGGETGQGGG